MHGATMRICRLIYLLWSRNLKYLLLNAQNRPSLSMWQYLLFSEMCQNRDWCESYLLLFQISLLALITVEVILICSCSDAFVVAEHISGVVLSTVTFKMSVEKNHAFSVHTAVTVPKSNLIFSNIYETSIKPLLLASFVLNYIHRSFVWLLSNWKTVGLHSSILHNLVALCCPVLYKRYCMTACLISFILFTTILCRIIPTL